jgi:hypothetical protein
MSTLTRQPTLDQCETALRAAWRRETSADPAGWSPFNPSLGQCAVTALIVQDVFGGCLLRAALPDGSHYWNLLPDGREVDLTRAQFGEAVDLSDVVVRSREYVLSSPDTELRYRVLSDAVRRALPAIE